MGNRQRVILCEGTDRSGKSTIGKLISEKLNISYFKYTRDKEALSGSDMTSAMLKYTDPYFCDFLKQTKASVVIDRHYPSEWTYSQILGRKTDEDGIRRTDELFSQIPATILILKRKSYVGVSDDDPRLDSSTLEKISQKYDEFAKWSKCRVLTFEFDEWNPEKMVTEILFTLEAVENTYDIADVSLC